MFDLLLKKTQARRGSFARLYLKQVGWTAGRDALCSDETAKHGGARVALALSATYTFILCLCAYRRLSPVSELKIGDASIATARPALRAKSVSTYYDERPLIGSMLTGDEQDAGKRQAQESGPGRQEQGAGRRIEASDGSGDVEESEESEGREEGLVWGEEFGRKLQELKEYKRRHGDMLHVAIQFPMR